MINVNSNIMDKIKLKRGGKEITFKKVPNLFAVRLRKGKAKDASLLGISSAKLDAEPTHVDSAQLDNMEIFSIEESKMEDSVDALRTISQNEIVTHLYSSDDSAEGAFIPIGTMTVQFNPELENNAREEILREHGLEIVKELDYLPHGYVVRLTSASTKNPLKIAQALQKKKGIVIAEPDLSFKVSYKFIPNDTLYRDQWHLNNTGDGTGLKEGADVKAEAAWEYTLGARSIIICVMDDGFDVEHPDFNAPGKIVAKKDFGDNDVDPSPGSSTDNHGTACAGVALAEQNGTGVVGLAPGCSFMPVRTSVWLSDTSIEDLFQYAIDNHADVISCSWAAAAAYFPLSARMTGIIHKAATQGRSNGKGCVILFAAGNESAPLNGIKDNITYHQGFALHPDVIAVAASNSLDEQSYYSNYGPEITICAPSNGSPGRGIVTTDRRGANGYSSNDYTYSFGGTSSATPLCAGLAGLILSINPDLASAEVRTIIMDTADKIDPVNGQYADGHSPLYGHGRVNAHKAVVMAAGENADQRLPESLYVEHRVNSPIPDNGQLEDVVNFCNDVLIKEVEINVDIKHTWRGDLRLTLTSPQGERIVLADRTGGSQDDIVRSFRSSDEPDMFAPVVGKSAKGEWRLKIEDMAEQDVGILAKWGLAITY